MLRFLRGSIPARDLPAQQNPTISLCPTRGFARGASTVPKAVGSSGSLLTIFTSCTEHQQQQLSSGSSKPSLERLAGCANDLSSVAFSPQAPRTSQGNQQSSGFGHGLHLEFVSSCQRTSQLPSFPSLQANCISAGTRLSPFCVGPRTYGEL